MRRLLTSYIVLSLLVVGANFARPQAAQAIWTRLAALGFEAVGGHACTDGITFRLADLDPRTYTANHVVITSTLALETIADKALPPIPANPIKVPPIPHSKIRSPNPEPGPVPTSQPNTFASVPPVPIAGSKIRSPK